MAFNRGNLIEEDHYYPYGQIMAGISSRKIASPYEWDIKNNYLYNDKQFFDEGGLNIGDYPLRNYDPQIGRWWQADPYDQFASPYTGIGNNPINLVDPSGGFSLDFGTLGQITGSVLADRALITFGGALLGFGVDKLSGGSGWKGAAIGGAMAFGATYLPPINFGSGGGGAIGGIDAGANVARAGFGMLNTSVKEAVANAPMGVSLSSREPLIMQANISKTPAVRGRVIVGDVTDMVPQKAVTTPQNTAAATPKLATGKGGFKNIIYQRTTQTNISTTGVFSIPGANIKGYFLEPSGPSTTTSGLNKRIPAGTYKLIRNMGEKYGLRLYNYQVPQSRAILIHIGNIPRDTRGCLLPGNSIGVNKVGGSGLMINQLMNYFNKYGFDGATITIYDIK